MKTPEEKDRGFYPQWNADNERLKSKEPLTPSRPDFSTYVEAYIKSLNVKCPGWEKDPQSVFNVILGAIEVVYTEMVWTKDREPSTEQSGGTEQEIEKVFDWAKCGIYHNHAYNEDKLRDCLDVLERVMKLLNRKP